jgi:hypothetical protein
MDAEVDYERTAADDWTQRAKDLYQSGQLRVAPFNTNGVVSVQIWGTCPRCAHSLDVQQTLTAPLVTRGGWPHIGKQNTEIPPYVLVGCGCGVSHDGAPSQVTGCGVTFRLPTAPPTL